MVFLARARSDMRARSAAVLICSAEIFCRRAARGNRT